MPSRRTPGRVIIATDGPGVGGPTWTDIVRERWPVQSPEIEVVPLAGLVDRLAETDRPATAVLAVAGGGLGSADLCHLIDALQDRLVPAVVLLPQVDQGTGRMHGGGVILAALDADTQFVVTCLFALAERQATVDALRTEVRIAAKYQGGVSGEMDRIHDELKLAGSVQQELLPKSLPSLPGLRCGVLFRPAGYVSGDIYDLVPLDEHRLGFFLADAVGHGVPAALMTMILARSLRPTKRGTGGRVVVAPGAVMTKLNEDLVAAQRSTPRFATAVYGYVDTRTREVTLAGAGHPPPLRIRGPGEYERVETSGPLLGVFPGERYEEVNFTLQPDETLLVYSDGFETAFARVDQNGRPDLRRGSHDYVDQLVSVPWPGPTDAPMTGAINDLAQRLDRHAGSLHQIDDVTAVAISAAPRAGSRTAA